MPLPKITSNPTEQTTAITDLLLAALALIAAIFLTQLNTFSPWKALLWSSNFGLLAAGAALGGVVHAVSLPHRLSTGLWRLIYLLLGHVVGLFTVGAVYDLWGLETAQIALPTIIGIALIFFAVVTLRSGAYFILIVYEVVAMTFALLGYLWLAFTAGLPGAWWMVAGIVVTLLAAVAQTRHHLRFELIWQFDHNGVYHLVQMVGIVLLVIGLRAGL